jgi:hypothetical protein
MKNLKNTTFLKGKSDSGAALALVLLMVVFLSLWLSSVFLFTASSSKAVDSTIAKGQAQEATMNSALEAALSVLNSPGQYLGATAVTNAAGASSCANANLSYTTASGTVVSISCTQSATSGVTGPLASFVLTGTGTNCGTSCVVGVNGGLAITTTNNTCSTQGTIKVAGGFYLSTPLVTGVNGCTLQLNSGSGSNPTQIIAPTGGNNNFTGGTPIVSASVNNGNGQSTQPAPVTPITSNDANASSPNSTQQFYQKTENAKLDKAPTVNGASGVKNSATLVSISGDCRSTSNLVSRTWTGGDKASHTLKAVWVNTSKYTTSKGNYYGWIDDTKLATINSLVASCAAINAPIVFAAFDGSSMKTDKAGVYRLQPNGPTSPRYELYLKSNVRFSSGVPLESSSKIVGCDTQLPGAQLQFADQSFLRIGESKAWFCDPTTLNANYENQAHACAAPNRMLASDDFSWNSIDTNGNDHTNSAGTHDFIYMDDENSSSVASYDANPANYDNEGSDDAGNLSSAEKRTIAAKYLGRTATDSDVASLETGSDSKSKSYRDERRKTESKRSTATENRDDFKAQTGITDVNFEGSCYAPAATAHLFQSAHVKSTWGHGAVFMAMSIKIGATKAGEDLAPLSMQSQNLNSGQRQVQLKMYDETHKVNGAHTFIGAVNVAIDDKFGYTNRIGSDYRILSRVVAPTH